MNRLLKAAAISVMVLIGAQQVGAVTSTPTYVKKGVLGGWSYATYTIASLTNSTIDTTIINVQNLAAPYIGASGVISIALTNAFSGSAAGDSCWVALDFGPTVSGPWRSNNALVVNTLTGPVPMKTNAVVATTNPGFLSPYWRIRTIGKGTTVTNAKMYLFFPTIGILPK